MFVAGKQFNQAGLTLIELLVTIAMITILATVAMPNISAWNCRQNTVKDFTDLASGIAYLQGLAKDRNRSMRLQAAGAGRTVTYTYHQSMDVARRTACIPSMARWTRLTGEQTTMNGTLDLRSPRSACFHGDGSATWERPNRPLTWQVGQQCDGQPVSYRITVFGSTGFMEKMKWNASTNTWMEY